MVVVAVALLLCGGGRPELHKTCDVYLLIGQSNMAGRGKMLPQDTLPIRGVWLLDGKGKAVVATNPLNRYSTIRKSLPIQQIGPGYAFAREIHRRTHRQVLLVVNARGGSSIKEWMPDNTKSGFFRDAVQRAREAQRYGILRGILWHQGESDSGDTTRYLQRLGVLVEALRQELGEELPFVAGEIAPWHKNHQPFNEMIHRIGNVIPHADWVSSAGTTPLIDTLDPHFSRDGQLLLGGRYAEKILKIVYRK